ncbi:MAG: lipase [Clostridia bacterium]|nr:lipase [Clostridia bacterium]
MKRILCIGDSNTYGFDPRSYLGSRYPEDVRWTGRIAAAGFEAVNGGVNGRAFPRGGELPVLSAWLASKLPADAVLILLGTNDLLLGRTAEETGRRASAMLETVCAQLSGGSVLLIAPPRLVAGEWVNDPRLISESALLSAELRRAAEQNGVCFADAGCWGIQLVFDGVHFSPEGHACFAECLLKELEKMSGKTAEE